MARGIKKGNDYVGILEDMYKNTPKSVFAAIAISFVIQLDGEEVTKGHVQRRLIGEWDALNKNGIVPQKPLGFPYPESDEVALG